jgi:tetratricopeptide (TPR) repeat protein
MLRLIEENYRKDVKVIVFDSPGIVENIDKISRRVLDAGKFRKDIYAMDINHVVSTPNVVNTLNTKIGEDIVTVVPKVADGQMLNSIVNELLKLIASSNGAKGTDIDDMIGSFSTHYMTAILPAFDPVTGEFKEGQVKRVKSWPVTVVSRPNARRDTVGVGNATLGKMAGFIDSRYEDLVQKALALVNNGNVDYKASVNVIRSISQEQLSQIEGYAEFQKVFNDGYLTVALDSPRELGHETRVVYKPAADLLLTFLTTTSLTRDAMLQRMRNMLRDQYYFDAGSGMICFNTSRAPIARKELYELQDMALRILATNPNVGQLRIEVARNAVALPSWIPADIAKGEPVISRDEYYQKIDSLLEESGSPKVVCITAQEVTDNEIAVGTKSFAQRYATTKRDLGYTVRWVDASSSETLNEHVIKVAAQLNIRPSGIDINGVIAAIARKLRSMYGSKYLLVLNGVTNMEYVKVYVNTLCKTIPDLEVVITTKSDIYKDYSTQCKALNIVPYQMVELLTATEAELKSFLSEYLPQEDSEQLAKLLELIKTGRESQESAKELSLQTVVMMVKYLLWKDNFKTVRDLYDNFKLHQNARNAEEYIFAQLKAEGKYSDSIKILNQAAFLDYNFIPTRLFMATLKTDVNPIITAGEMQYIAKPLIKTNLVIPDRNSSGHSGLRVNEVTGKEMLASMTDDERKASVKALIDALSLLMPSINYDYKLDKDALCDREKEYASIQAMEDDSREFYKSSLALTKAIERSPDLIGDNKINLAHLYQRIGNYYEYLGMARDKAIACYLKSLRLFLNKEVNQCSEAELVREVKGLTSARPNRREIMTVLNCIIRAKSKLSPQPINEVEECAKAIEVLYLQGPDDTNNSRNYLVSCSYLATAYEESNQHDNAKIICDSILEKVENEPNWAKYQNEYALTLVLRVNRRIAQSTNNIREVLTSYSQSMDILNSITKGDVNYDYKKDELANILNSFAIVCGKLNFIETSLLVFTIALQMKIKIWGNSESSQSYIMMSNICESYYRLAIRGTDTLQKKKFLQLVLNINATARIIKERVNGEKHFSVALAYRHDGQVYHEQRDYDRAITYFQKALDIANSSGNSNAEAIAIINIEYAKSLIAQGKFDEAVKHFNNAAIFKEVDLSKIINPSESSEVKAKEYAQFYNENTIELLQSGHMTATELSNLFTSDREKFKLVIEDDNWWIFSMQDNERYNEKIEDTTLEILREECQTTRDLVNVVTLIKQVITETVLDYLDPITKREIQDIKPERDVIANLNNSFLTMTQRILAAIAPKTWGVEQPVPANQVIMTGPGLSPNNLVPRNSTMAMMS